MKIIVILLCLLFPVAAAAQNQGMQGVDIEKMMQLMQEMQKCMEKVDQNELLALEKESEKVSKELEQLCTQGKRDQAQKKAIAYSKEMMKNPSLVQMKECSEMTKGLIPEGESPSLEDEFDFSNRHVCDD